MENLTSAEGSCEGDCELMWQTLLTHKYGLKPGHQKENIRLSYFMIRKQIYLSRHLMLCLILSEIK